MHINNGRQASYLYAEMVVLDIRNSRLVSQCEWSQKGMHDFNPYCNWEAAPPVTVPVQELGDGLLHSTRTRLPGITKAAKKGREYGSASRCSQLWGVESVVMEEVPGLDLN